MPRNNRNSVEETDAVSSSSSSSISDTSSSKTVNTSSIQTTGVLRAPPTVVFTPHDYVGWSYSMRTLLEYGDMWRFVDPSQQATVDVQVQVQDAHLIRQAHVMLVTAIQDPESRSLLVDIPHNDPRSLWKALESHYLTLTAASLAQLKSDFWRVKQGNKESVREFADRIKKSVHRLRACDPQDEPSVKDMNSVFITGVRPAYSHAVVALLACHTGKDTIPFTRLVDLAHSEESRLVSHMQPVPMASFPVNAMLAQCYVCKQDGHMKMNCPQLASRTATQSEIAQGRCSLPGHKSHLASQCKKSMTSPSPNTTSTGSIDKKVLAF